jgi:ubiquitin thioesterase OTU1
VNGSPEIQGLTCNILLIRSWGGEIELTILCDHFETGIDCIDVKTGHIYQYGESYLSRCILVYSGIHYDSVAMSDFPQNPELDITSFTLDEFYSDNILSAAMLLVKRLRERRYYVDTASFTIVCEECGKGLKGQKDAVKHLQETGHSQFQEIPPEED